MFDSEISNEEGEKQLIFPRKKNPYFDPCPKITDFKQIRYISKGAFGIVEEYFHPKNKEKFALKKMSYKNDSYSGNNIREIKRELEMLYRINNEYIVRLFDHFEDGNDVYLIMEYVDGKNLFEEIYKSKKELTFHIVCSIIEEICFGLEYLHAEKIVHRDIKLENIIIQNGSIKIIDLGESNFFGEEIMRTTTRGTRTYFSPEILNREIQDDRVDVWCLGVVIFEIICLKPPFLGKNEDETNENIRRIRYQIPEKIKHEKELIDLLMRIFTYKNQRIPVSEVRKHSFIKKYLGKDQQKPIKYENVVGEGQLRNYRSFLEGQIEHYRRQIQLLLKENEEIDQDIEQSKKRIAQIDIKQDWN